jgi:type II secretory pathway component PulC
MIRIFIQLMLLSLVVATGVHWGYSQLEKKINQLSCFPQENSSQHKELDPLIPEVDETPLDTRIILQRNVFQTGLAPTPVLSPPHPPKEIEPVVEVVVPTSLNLSLVGTVVGGQKNSRAIIVDPQKRGEQQLLQVGDGIQGAIVEAIAWDRVILDVNGKREILEMPKPQDGGLPSSVVQVQAHAHRLTPGSAPDGRAEQTRLPRPPPLRPQRRIDLPPAEPSADLEMPPHELSPSLDEILLPPMD